MLYVYLKAKFSLGHHVFADSVNNGPWGQVLTEELIPALEKKFGAAAVPQGRFLTGQSSGGWSSLWLQITYPEFFGGTWSTAPDPVDFRDFTGINVYEYDNAFVDPDGKDIQLMRRGDQWKMTLKQYVDREMSRKSYEGQFASFDAVFSPRGKDGRPMPMFDRKTGKIDREVARTWERYDIRLILKRNWETLGPRLKGKIRIYMGTLDTFRLEGATRLLKEELEELGSDAEIVFAEGRGHASLYGAHAELWPDGLMLNIHRQMRNAWDNRDSK
ncbi:MAG: alpha/beta hydrolase-fold protein [Planctomycetota bacterium]